MDTNETLSCHGALKHTSIPHSTANQVTYNCKPEPTHACMNVSLSLSLSLALYIYTYIYSLYTHTHTHTHTLIHVNCSRYI
jgi:hypothetical protein